MKGYDSLMDFLVKTKNGMMHIYAQGMLVSTIWIDMGPRRRATRCEPMLVYPIPLYWYLHLLLPCIAIHKHCKGQLRIASSYRQAPKRTWIIQTKPLCTHCEQRFSELPLTVHALYAVRLDGYGPANIPSYLSTCTQG